MKASVIRNCQLGFDERGGLRLTGTGKVGRPVIKMEIVCIVLLVASSVRRD